MDKKNLFKTLLLFLLLCFFSINFAKANEDSQYFTVNYSIGRQSVWNNSIPINVYIIPKTDYSKVEITFNYGSMTEVKYSGPQYFPVKAGQTYQVQGKVFPKEKGPHHITINAISWEHDTNYTSSTSTTLNIDERLQIIPQTQEYKILKVLKYVFIITIILIIGLITYFLTKKNTLKIKKWLEPEF
jgi:hypothetical protein